MHTRNHTFVRTPMQWFFGTWTPLALLAVVFCQPPLPLLLCAGAPISNGAPYLAVPVPASMASAPPRAIADALRLLRTYSPDTRPATCIYPSDGPLRSVRDAADNDVEQWVALGELLVDDPGREVEAMHAFMCALLLDDHHVTAWLNVAQIVISWAHSKSPRATPRSAHHSHLMRLAAVESNPHDASALFAVAVSAMETLRDNRMGKRYMRRIIDLGSEAHQNLTAMEWYNRGQALAKLQNFQGAFDSFRRAAQLEPQHAGFAHRLYLLGNRLGYAKELRQEFLGPDDADGVTSFATELAKLTPQPPPVDVEKKQAGDSVHKFGWSELRQRAQEFLSSNTMSAVRRRTQRLREALGRHYRTAAGKRTCEKIRTTSQTVLLYALTARDAGTVVGTNLLNAVSSPQKLGLVTKSTSDADDLRAVVLGQARNDSVAPYGTLWDDGNFPITLVTLSRSLCGAVDFSPARGGRTSMEAAIEPNAQANVAARQQFRQSLHELTWLMDSVGVRHLAREDPAQLNAQDAYGYSPLHLSFFQCDDATFSELLAAGADPYNLRDKFGRSVADLVRSTTWSAYRSFRDLIIPVENKLETSRAASKSQVSSADGRNSPSQAAVAKPDDLEIEWESPRDTIDWGPLSSIPSDHRQAIERVDGRSTSIANIVRDFIAQSKPVIVTHAMDGCPATMKKWEKKAFLASDMANLTYNAYFIPYGEGGEETVTTTLGDFAKNHMGHSASLSDRSETPRYIFDRTDKGLMGSMSSRGTIEPFTSTLACIPRDLQEYMNLPPPRMPGGWGQWTLGMGGSGSGAPFHMHLKVCWHN
eukprot:INCI5867.2.p1 GENE.INCI5867.2~~INCI5867.2.p1  ORF type:complete len:815 (-),score=99.63 INCI5867.2:2887-5331(-)